MDIEKDPAANVVIDPINSEPLHRGFLKVARETFRFGKFDGTMSDPVMREVMDRGDSAAVLPYDPFTDTVALIRQFLPGAQFNNLPNRPLQIIAGGVGWNEFDQEVARREALEEAGITLNRLAHAHYFLPSPGASTERIATFIGEAGLAPEIHGSIHGLAEEHEDIRVELFTADEAIQLLDEGQIEAGPAVVALSWFARHRQALRSQWLASPSAEFQRRRN